MEPLNPEALYEAGLNALRRELGVVDMIRFLQQVKPGIGDYTAERYQWLPADEDIEQIMAEANRLASQSDDGSKAE